VTALPEWMLAPRPEGWFADDLDRLPEAPPHTELIHGALVFTMSPRPAWHSEIVSALGSALTDQASGGVAVERETPIRLDQFNRLEPDLLAVRTSGYDPERTFHTPDEVALVVEVVAPESAYRDRNVKLRKYAEAGIAHYWRVEEDDGSPVVHAYELDESTRSYVPVGIHRQELRTSRPFPINLDLESLLPDR
jgi:Uma2 family endonuclease